MNKYPFPTIPEADFPDSIEAAIVSRRSVRAFSSIPVPRPLLTHLLSIAAHAPSGANMQPWKIHVVTGKTKAKLEADLVVAFSDPNHPAEPEYHYYPSRWSEPYTSRRRKVGWDLYTVLGIEKRDLAAMHQQHKRNYLFFGAPVGLFFTIDRDLSYGSWLDVGMYIQNLMIAARAAGLHTCPQAAFTPYHQVVRRHIAIPQDEILLCGMSLGYEDRTKPENTLRTEREPVERFAFFHDE